jgi:Haspin like kinase domain
VCALQAALTLAIAEECLEFEHRDLHWGNLLLRALPGAAPPLRFVLRGAEYSIAHAGVRACLIDFTLARLRRGDGTILCSELDRLPGDWLFTQAGAGPQARAYVLAPLVLGLDRHGNAQLRQCSVLKQQQA